jgi:hypothetical protein
VLIDVGHVLTINIIGDGPTQGRMGPQVMVPAYVVRLHKESINVR